MRSAKNWSIILQRSRSTSCITTLFAVVGVTWRVWWIAAGVSDRVWEIADIVGLLEQRVGAKAELGKEQKICYPRRGQGSVLDADVDRFV